MTSLSSALQSEAFLTFGINLRGVDIQWEHLCLIASSFIIVVKRNLLSLCKKLYFHIKSDSDWGGKSTLSGCLQVGGCSADKQSHPCGLHTHPHTPQ